ncbi:MAG: glycine cleavage T C-terminal barrel domain-containing protein [Hyphomicrobiaceae bacterium]
MKRHTGAHITFQPRIRKGAFFEAAWRYGCRNFSVYNRTYISGAFSDPVEEYWHTVEHAALWPVMGERQVEVTGPDATRFVQYLTPRDISKCAVGQCKYALITAPDGGILSDPIILRLDEDRYWLSTSDWDLETWAKGVSLNSGMQITIRDANVSVLQVQGPKSPIAMAQVFGQNVLDLRYYWLMRLPFETTTVVVSRTGWSGEFGYEIYLESGTFADGLFDALMSVGETCNLKPGSVNQIRRLESGILSAGVDFTPAETPFDVGLGRLVELDSGAEFIGRNALAPKRDAPLEQQLVGLIVDGPALASNEDLWPLSSAGVAAGRLTSLAFSPRLERNIALGIVATDFASLQTQLEVATWDGSRTAVVTTLPFLPKKQSGDARAMVANY